MNSSIWKGQAFSVSHADGSGSTDSHFEGGLRAFFEYRDLGIAAATGGSYVAHVIRPFLDVMQSQAGISMILIFKWSIF